MNHSRKSSHNQAFLSPLPLLHSSLTTTHSLCSNSCRLPTTSTRRQYSNRKIHTICSSNYKNHDTTVERNEDKKNNNNNIWNGMNKLIKISTLSTSMFVTSLFLNPLQNNYNNKTIFKPSPTYAATNLQDETSDVEAAAITLGAVTLGGLFMRLIINRSRNDDEEKKKLADECKRLQEEEHDRTLRLKRSELESIPSSTTNTDEVDLMSELRKRMDNINNESENKQDNKIEDMRHTPIPDRGTGSALLERPSDNDDQSITSSSDNDSVAKQNELDMLKRMWNLSPPDKEKEEK